MQTKNDFWEGFNKAAASDPKRSKKFSMFLYKLMMGKNPKFKGHSSRSAFKNTSLGRGLK